MPSTKNIVILISGNGSNAQAIIEKCLSAEINGKVVAVISNRPDAFGLRRAKNFDIPAICLDHQTFIDRTLFDKSLADVIEAFAPDLIVLAGFMRILSAEFVNIFKNRLLNIHPSLLPKYPGLNTHKRALDAGDKHHGASVHFVTDELDGGPVVLKTIVSIDYKDNVESLASKVAMREWLIYPLVIAWFCENRLKLCKDNVILDDKNIPRDGLVYEDL